METLITTLLVVVVAMYIWKKYWANDSDKAVRVLEEYYEEHLKQTEGSKMLSVQKMATEYESLIKRLAYSYDTYLHLLEKYRHSLAQQWNLRQDWRNYIQTHKDVQGSDMDFLCSDEKLFQEAYDRKYRAEIKMTEIENRFKKLK